MTSNVQNVYPITDNEKVICYVQRSDHVSCTELLAVIRVFDFLVLLNSEGVI